MSDPARSQDDTALAASVRSSDPDAERELARRYHDRVFAVALAKLGDYDAADDVAQEALLRGLKAVRDGRLKQPDKLGSFLCGIARNLSNNHLRAKRPTETRSLDELISPTEQPEERYSRHEYRKLVARVLSEMDPIDQKILLWTLVDGLSAGEVAQQLGIKPAAVRQRKHRALQRARKDLESMSQPGSGGY